MERQGKAIGKGKVRMNWNSLGRHIYPEDSILLQASLIRSSVNVKCGQLSKGKADAHNQPCLLYIIRKG